MKLIPRLTKLIAVFITPFRSYLPILAGTVYTGYFGGLRSDTSNLGVEYAFL